MGAFYYKFIIDKPFFYVWWLNHLFLLILFLLFFTFALLPFFLLLYILSKISHLLHADDLGKSGSQFFANVGSLF